LALLPAAVRCSVSHRSAQRQRRPPRCRSRR